MTNLIFLASGFVLGAFALLTVLVERMVRADNWDRSNRTNALRVLGHIIIHPGDLFHMYYITREAGGAVMSYRKAFWYVDKDENSEVVKSRPTLKERGL